MRAHDVAAGARAVAARLGVDAARVSLRGRGVESGLLAVATSLASGLPLEGVEASLASLREVPDRFDDHPAICVPRLAELGDLPALVAAAPRAEGAPARR
jgi:hypothetical protein